MSVALLDLGALLDAQDDAAGRFTALLRRVEDGSIRAIGDWTVDDVATHLSHGFTEVYLADQPLNGSVFTCSSVLASAHAPQLRYR